MRFPAGLCSSNAIWPSSPSGCSLCSAGLVQVCPHHVPPMPHAAHPKEGFAPFSPLGEVWQISEAAQAQLEANTALFPPQHLKLGNYIKKIQLQNTRGNK